VGLVRYEVDLASIRVVPITVGTPDVARPQARSDGARRHADVPVGDLARTVGIRLFVDGRPARATRIAVVVDPVANLCGPEVLSDLAVVAVIRGEDAALAGRIEWSVSIAVEIFAGLGSSTDPSSAHPAVGRSTLGRSRFDGRLTTVRVDAIAQLASFRVDLRGGSVAGPHLVQTIAACPDVVGWGRTDACFSGVGGHPEVVSVRVQVEGHHATPFARCRLRIEETSDRTRQRCARKCQPDQAAHSRRH
jgi:hypothetical protein